MVHILAQQVWHRTCDSDDLDLSLCQTMLHNNLTHIIRYQVIDWLVT